MTSGMVMPFLIQDQMYDLRKKLIASCTILPNIQKVIKLKNKKANNPIKNWSRIINRQFIKTDIQVANKRITKCSTPHVIRETQIKTILN